MDTVVQTSMEGLTTVVTWLTGQFGGVIDTIVAECGKEKHEYASFAIPEELFAAIKEIGTVAAFLASEEASYVCGTTIVVDGGMTA